MAEAMECGKDLDELAGAGVAVELDGLNKVAKLLGHALALGLVQPAGDGTAALLGLARCWIRQILNFIFLKYYMHNKKKNAKQ